MKKHFFHTITTLILILTIASLYEFKEMNITTYAQEIEIIDSGNCGNGLYWELDINGLLTITGTGIMKDFQGTEAPWYNYNSNIQQIKLNDGIANIGDYAFYNCGNLTDIIISNTVESIGYYSFGECYKLKNVNIPDGVKIIKERSFFGCGISHLNIGNGVIIIEDEAFYGCSSLISISLGENIEQIGKDAFAACQLITSINIPKSLKTVGDGAFWMLGNLSTVYYYSTEEDWNNIEFGKNNTSLINSKIYYTYRGSCGENLTWELSGGTLTLSGNGNMVNFTDSSDIPWATICSQIESIHISIGITSIGDRAFLNCTSLETLVLPSSILKIGNYAFYGCSSLLHICYQDNIQSFQSLDCGLNNNTFKNANIFYNYYPKHIILTGLCGNNISWILDTAGLLSITGSGSMYDYGSSYSSYSPWYSKKELIKMITVGNDVSKIGKYSFYKCSNLEIITLGANITSIAESALLECNSLKEIIVDTNNTYLHAQNGILYNKDLSTLIKYPSALNSKFFNIPHTVSNISDYAFTNAIYLTKVRFSNTVKYIGNSAFKGCNLLSTAHYNGTNIDWDSISIMQGNDSLLNATIQLTTIGNCGTDSIYTIDPLGKLTITGTAKMDNYIDSQTIPWLKKIQNISTVIINNSITHIGERAFFNCINLSVLIIDKSVTSIGDYAFINCNSLKYICYTGSKEDWSLIYRGIGNELLSSATLIFDYDNNADDFKNTTNMFIDKSGDIIVNQKITFESLLPQCGYTSMVCDEYGIPLKLTSPISTGSILVMQNNSTHSIIVIGDCDKTGTITSADARTALRAAVGLDELTETQQKAADVNKDGILNSADARSILRCAVGLETFD